jgi:hypothetical protein
MEGFNELLDDWIAREQPTVRRHDAVVLWLIEHGEDPYPEIRRELAIPGEAGHHRAGRPADADPRLHDSNQGD